MIEFFDHFYNKFIKENPVDICTKEEEKTKFEKIKIFKNINTPYCHYFIE